MSDMRKAMSCATAAAVTSLASQLDSLDESHEKSNELRHGGGKSEIPAPEEDGVDDFVVVGTAPPLVVQKLDGE